MTDKPKVDLNLSKGCCGEGVKLKGQIGPFNRAIALEYGEDRPVVGVARCATCGDCFKFVRLDYTDTVTIFSLAPMPSNSLTLLEQGYSRLKKPSWPIWVPPTESQMKDKEKEIYDKLEVTILDRASPPTLVIATKHLINGRILAADNYREDIKQWIPYLGVK